MLETGRRLAKGIPGAPRVQMGTSLDYFKRLEKNLSNNKKVPKWVGELYLEYHRGTYTSMARNKRDNRRCENLYVAADIGKVTFENICRRILPMLGVSLIALLLVTFIPWLSTCLIK